LPFKDANSLGGMDNYSRFTSTGCPMDNHISQFSGIAVAAIRPQKEMLPKLQSCSGIDSNNC
jgi:hypothetical protein